MKVTGKLYALLKTGEPGEDNPEFLWSQIRLLLIDLHIDSASSPDSKMV